jgi:hypothetical protein
MNVYLIMQLCGEWLSFFTVKRNVFDRTIFIIYPDLGRKQ